MEIGITLNEQSLTVTGNYEPEDRGVHTYPNGDPGYPGTSSDFEVETIIWNKPIPLVGGSIEYDVTDLIFALDKEDEVIELTLNEIER